MMLVFELSCILRFIVFFFSSRRRHTRWPRDWSSDVCSSDLFSIAAAAAKFAAGVGVALKYTENRTYLLYLLSDAIWTWEFSNRQRPEWDQRIDGCARYLADVARESDAEEIIDVGDISGSFLESVVVA